MGEDQDVCCVLLQQQRPDKKYVQDMIVLHRYLQVIDDVQRPLLMASYVCTWQICTNKTHTRTYQLHIDFYTPTKDRHDRANHTHVHVILVPTKHKLVGVVGWCGSLVWVVGVAGWLG